MFPFKPALSLALVTSLVSPLTTATVHAQAGAPSPAISFQSALDSYQPYREEKIKPWRESNDTVGKVGGWRAYAKEAAEPSSSAKGTPPAPATSGHPHAGHGKQ